MIRTALIMCGGKSKKFKGEDKSLMTFYGKKAISYVFGSLKESRIKKIIIIANKNNSQKIKTEAEKYFQKFILINNSPRRFREGIKKALKHLDKKFLFLVGNQPLKKSHVHKLLKVSKEKNSWAVSLYKRGISKESTLVMLNKSGKIIKGDAYVMQHPMVLTKEIVRSQENEKFKFKIEKTVKNLINKRKIYGVISDMPPEFDNGKMLENTKKYIQKKFNKKGTLILLPGNDPSTKNWIEKIKLNLRSLFSESVAQYYNHWSKSNMIDLNVEEDRLINNLKNKKDYYIFAKSVGILVALKAIKEEKITPKKCIFLGFPYAWAKNNLIDPNTLIKDYSIPTIFIQNYSDPFCSSNNLKKILSFNSVSNHKLIVLKGNTHDYEDVHKIKRLVKDFLFT